MKIVTLHRGKEQQVVSAFNVLSFSKVDAKARQRQNCQDGENMMKQRKPQRKGSFNPVGISKRLALSSKKTSITGQKGATSQNLLEFHLNWDGPAK